MTSRKEIEECSRLAGEFSDWETNSVSDSESWRWLTQGQDILWGFEEEKHEEAPMECQSVDIPCAQQVVAISDSGASSLGISCAQKDDVEASTLTIETPPIELPHVVPVSYLFDTPHYAFHPLITLHPIIPRAINDTEFSNIGT